MASLREVPSDLSSRSSSGLEDSVRIRLSFGGKWKRQENDQWQYVDGETYLEKLSAEVKYADLMHLVNEKINGAAIFKYTPPGEQLCPNNLVTVVDDSHLQEMLDLIDEYTTAQRSGNLHAKRFRLNVWLSRAAEEDTTDWDEFMQSYVSETDESDMSDGTQNPMPQYSKGTGQSQHTDPDDAGMQARIAEEDCNYLNAMEEAESTEASRLQYPLTQADSEEWYLVPRDDENLGGQSAGSQDNLKQHPSRPPRTVKMSSLEPGTPDPDTPPLSQRNAFRLPSSLGASLGHAHRQNLSASIKPLPYRLPSKLGSSLGNSSSGTMFEQTSGRLPPSTYRVSSGNTVTKPPIARPKRTEEREFPQTGRTTPNGTPISSGNVMDHFHTVPASQLKAVAKLGEGTFGEVLQCTNRLFGDVAVKCAKAEGNQDLFTQEVRMLSSLNHPNVLRFFGVVIDEAQDSKIVGVMTEFMQGRSLSYYLGPEYPRWSLLERAKLARGAANGLMYLHKHDIIHLDIKTENLLLDYPLGQSGITPGIKVADFGLSKYKVDNFAALDSGLRGTLPYMAPEITMPFSQITEKADIWSLGMVLWEMYTHSVPYGDMSAQEITSRLRSGNAFPRIPPDMEPEWAELIEACCLPSPNNRFSLENIAAMLDQIIQSEISKGLAY